MRIFQWFVVAIICLCCLGCEKSWLNKHITEPELVTTKDGKKVIMYPDGSWKRCEEEGPVSSTPERFVIKDHNAYGLKYDVNVWKLYDHPSSPDYDMEFEHLKSGVYAYVLYSPKRVSIDKLHEYAFDNAGKVMDQIKMDQSDTFVLGDHGESFRLKLAGWYCAEPDVDLVYDGYYYAGDRGTIQFVCYTTPLLYDELKQDIDSLLTGLVMVSQGIDQVE